MPFNPELAEGKGTLYIVSTPIGNLEDITLRALRILKEVDLIACEDTRVTRKLLTHYQISKPLVSYFQQNQLFRIPYLIGKLKEGTKLALVSDAGTPGISDPGFFLIQEAIKEEIKIIPLPGASAAITALVVSGLPADDFIFIGFLPRKRGKITKELLKANELKKTIVFYESPYRIKKTLEIIKEILPEAKMSLARELTKIFEEVLRGSAEDLLNQIGSRQLKGEIIVVLYPGRNLGELTSSAEPLNKEIESSRDF